ncbi:MAG: ATP-binding protein [Saprospiraceae bacterium]
MGAASPGDISTESWDLLKRATTVFSLAYTRFNDLQLAEASTKDAIKQAALDRIRAEIASMRTIADLDRITPLIWNELNILGIPFIRCGVFIMDDSQQLIHTFLSTPDGKAIAAFHLPYDTPGNIAQVLSHWRDKKNYIDHWDEAVFTEFANTLVRQGALTSSEQYLKTLPPGGFYLHFLPFLQGMLYVGNTTKLSDEETKLVQSIADAFSTAYARYEDFNKLEAAKQQVDKTLVDLKQAQQQLVQSEKMASLGELTAGIAHEIQNPLNFVNNFSEVNTELLDELREELAIGNKQQAIEIVDTVKENSEKINHHGKRAESIVKGMLQHSRKSTGTKEPADINALADEYMRLSYHGLRAKDKTFNAEFKMDLDATMPLIKVIPQDIGRVLLNLFNNAFWAVAEKSKNLAGLSDHTIKDQRGLSDDNTTNPASPAGRFAGSSYTQANSNLQSYQPTVALTTKNLTNHIEITIHDNGSGIPSSIKEKIFQPFFTTKPTGQGTGLGLSLAYDIIKAHGGSIAVNTYYHEPGSANAISIFSEPGEISAGPYKKVETSTKTGTTFIIQLPIK